MKTLIMTMLALAAVGANVAFAAENDGIVSAAPAIADPVNLQPGLLANAYRCNCNQHFARRDIRLKGFKSATTLPALEKATSIKTYEDKNSTFSRGGISEGIDANVIKWEGFIKCPYAASYTFLFKSKNAYSLYVNGRQLIDAGAGQVVRNIDLKLGWNKVVIVAEFYRSNDELTICYRPKNSMSEPIPLSPSILSYAKPVEADQGTWKLGK